MELQERGKNMIKEGWGIVTNATRWYFSNGNYWFLLLFSISICLFWGRKNAKFLTGYTIIYSILVLNPFSALLLTKLGLDGQWVYLRVFWMIPMGCLIAYAFVKIIFLVNKKIIRGLVVTCSVVVIIHCGKFIYTSDNFQLAENAYKIPDDVIEVCEYLEPGNAVLAPADMIYWLRTYNADIYLPIGRQEYTFGGSTERNTLVASLSDSSVTDVKYFADGALQWGCRYIIVENNRQFEGEWEQYGYTFKSEAGKYQIYEKA